jgi:hypothetical protein
MLTSLWRGFRLNQSGNKPAIARVTLQLKRQEAANAASIYNGELPVV